MNHGQLYDDLIYRLTELGIESGEAEAEARMLFRDGLGLNLSRVLAERGTTSAAAVTSQPDNQATLTSHSFIITDYLERRARHEPPQYIVRQAAFWDFTVCVAPGVLIPRPETEHLVEAVLHHLPAAADRILEIGTGSGAPLAAILRERPCLQAVATDVSTTALEIARQNFITTGVMERVEIRLDDLYTGEDHFPLVFSNPPYIAEQDRQSLALELQFEPEQALFSGVDGLDVIRRILTLAPDWLEPHGLLLFELGNGQMNIVSDLGIEAGFSIRQIINDYSLIPRVLVLECRT